GTLDGSLASAASSRARKNDQLGPDTRKNSSSKADSMGADEAKNHVTEASDAKTVPNGDDSDIFTATNLSPHQNVPTTDAYGKLEGTRAKASRTNNIDSENYLKAPIPAGVTATALPLREPEAQASTTVAFPLVRPDTTGGNQCPPKHVATERGMKRSVDTDLPQKEARITHRSIPTP
ncbi:unnamed protein product, partial [Sphacelaria rigidula]